jgi:hypothetical protein
MKMAIVVLLTLLATNIFASESFITINNVRALNPANNQPVDTFNGSSSCHEGFERDVKIAFDLETKLDRRYVSSFCTVYNLRDLSKVEAVGSCTSESFIFKATDSCGDYLISITAIEGMNDRSVTSSVRLTFWAD